MSKKILITGASSGIGRATAEKFQKKGWNVIATMRTPEKEESLNTLENVLVTKLDVLDGLETIRVCIDYKSADGIEANSSFGSEYYETVTPVYEDLPGWQESTLGVQSFEQLPANAQAYIKHVEEAVGAPIDIISTGPDRNETIILNDPFQNS